MKTKFPLSKIAGILFTAGLTATSVAPNTFNISIPIRPWLFIFNIVWITAICSGIFTP